MKHVLLAIAALALLSGCQRQAGPPAASSLDLAPAANLGFADPVAGDGAGGWSDQGPGNDFADFDVHRTVFAGVPMSVIDPATHGGRSILAFRHRTLPGGLARVALAVPAGAHGRWLYLLHASCWNALPPGTEIGRIVVRDPAGGERRRPVRAGHEVADWWYPAELPAARVVVRRGGGASLGVYLARIDLGEDVQPAEIGLETTGEALWIVVAATLSATDLGLPAAGGPGDAVEVRTGDGWAAMPAAGAPMPGSAMDLAHGSAIAGRLVADGEHLADAGGRRRLLGLSLDARLALRDPATAAETARLRGADVVRLDAVPAAVEADPAALDALFTALRSRGLRILLNLPADAGVLAGEPTARDAWDAAWRSALAHATVAGRGGLAGVAAVLPGVDRDGAVDPRLLPAWRRFLAQRYHDAAAWRDAWTGPDPTAGNGLAEAPLYTCADGRDRGRRGRDVADFVTGCESEATAWLIGRIRAAGWDGLAAAGPAGAGLPARAAAGTIAVARVDDEPTGGIAAGSRMSGWSAFGGALGWWRDIAAQRVAGLPLLVASAGPGYWGRNRREVGLVLAAHAAYQDLPLVVAGPVPASGPIRPGADGADPIAHVQGTLGALLYRDARLPPASRRIVVPATAPGDARPALVTGFAVGLAGTATTTPPSGGFGAVLAELRRGGAVAADNASDPGQGIFASDGGGILLRAWQGRFEVSAPGFSGACLARVQRPVDLGGLRVDEASVPVTCALADLRGSDTARSSRLLLVLATDARNGGEQYEDPELDVLHRPGDGPVLIRTGSFAFAVRRAAAAVPLSAWTIGLDGRRIDRIATTPGDGWLRLELDTGALPGGPTPYVELSGD